MSRDQDSFSFIEGWAECAGVHWAPSPPTLRDGWFLGSALQLYDLKTLDVPKGMCRFVDTIWTRHIDLLPPNLYWELHNELFHSIWTGPAPAFAAVAEFVAGLRSAFSIAADDLVLVSEDGDLSRILNPGSVVPASVPFVLSGVKVGAYAKLFVRRPDGTFPLLDLVVFEFGGGVCTEIHLNVAHVRVAAGEIPTIYSMASKRPTMVALRLSEQQSALARSSRTVRIIALADALRHASAEGAQFSGTRAGHIYKRMAKSLAEDLIVTENEGALDTLGLAAGATAFVGREMDQILRLDVNKLRSMAPEYRRETLGVSDARLDVAAGSAADPAIRLPAARARYFTDLPLLGARPRDEIEANLAELVAARTN
ncbi:hypothetical protein [Arthrobacter sp. UM1]|uniref:hypothetical protein n=1 Tax=Arthrobacter sp. UM1 TaxID=2766776 RepID=UPI001CF6A303|nr:hypothetical protein [Arthrobacter sp. UM1]MCB4208586.1 hypothetical protein [Arthrobacter sp. UM1]